MSPVLPVQPTTNFHHEAPAANASVAGAWTPGMIGFMGLALLALFQLAHFLCVLSGLKFGLQKRVCGWQQSSAATSH